MKNRRTKILMLLILLSMGGSVVLFVSIPHEPLLLERATRVVDTRGWDPIWHFYHFYRWIDDHEILFVRINSSGPSGATNLNFYKCDTITGEQTALTSLSRLAQASEYNPSRFAISPDGKRVAWTLTQDPNALPRIVTWIRRLLPGFQTASD